MSIEKFCKPRPSVFASDRRATVLSLDTFLKEQVDGPEFFEEDFFTNGILRALESAGGNQSEAARLLGISPQAISKFLQQDDRYNLDRKNYNQGCSA
ncbi:MAG: ATPase-like protein [Chthoniobacteraceae bacterium]|nr:ATPase-like protein [Chthoniobacteraceae bacterium]